MFVLLTFQAQRVSAVEVAREVEMLQAIVEKREGVELSWQETNEGVWSATSPVSPLFTYQIRRASVR